MATEFQMPKLGLTMEAGTIKQWLVPDGAEVSPGDAVLLIETDKVESEIESSGGGILHQTGMIGTTYDCGTRIGWYLDAGEPVPDEPAPLSSSAAGAGRAVGAGGAAGSGPATGVAVAARGDGGRILASPNAKRVAARLGVDLAAVSGSGPGGRIVSEDIEAASRKPRPVVPGPNGARPTIERRSGRALATFAARNLADLLGVDLDEVASLSGDLRLTKDDVAAHVRTLLAAGGSSTAGPAPASREVAPLLQTPSATVPLRGMRGVIAERMHSSLQQMAQLSLTMDVDMAAVMADRARREAAASDGSRPVPGITDYVIAATARALAAHPYANSQVTADGVAHLPEINVGLAVAVDDGLMVPVIRDTPSLDLEALAAETRRLADSARAGTLQFAELEGGTFSVTALGMYGVDGFTPVINPPNTAILGVGRLRDGVRWDGDAPARATVLTLSLTWDHRAFDGAPAAELTRTIKHNLESGELA